jgi:hypothetical protein
MCEHQLKKFFPLASATLRAAVKIFKQKINIFRWMLEENMKSYGHIIFVGVGARSVLSVRKQTKMKLKKIHKVAV